MNGMKLQVVLLQIRFKSCRIAIDNEIYYDVKGSGSRAIDVGGWGGTWMLPKPSSLRPFRHTRDRSFISLRFCQRS